MPAYPADVQVHRPRGLVWHTPTWRWWWSRTLMGHHTLLRTWLPDALHQDMDAWAPPSEQDTALDVFVVLASEVHRIPQAALGSHPTAVLVLMDLFAELPSVPTPNAWLIPWRPEQGIQHPRIIRWVQEWQHGFALIPSASGIGTTEEGTPLAQWFATIYSRILAHRGIVVLAEVGSQPVLAHTIVERLRSHPQWEATVWHTLAPVEVTESEADLVAWLKPVREPTAQRVLMALYGAESLLCRIAQRVQKDPSILWLWLPKPSQLAHAWYELVHLFPTPSHPLVWSQWAWQRFCAYPWPDDMGTVLHSWERLIRLTEMGPLLMTSSRLQMLLTGRLPVEAPEPLANLIISLIHTRIQAGHPSHLMAEIEGLFERSMLQFATRMFATLPEATRVLGISRATLLRKLERYQIPNPWSPGRKRRTGQS